VVAVYQYRWYDPATGRWPSRDPIEEEGGINLYGFVGNDCVNHWDLLGMVIEWWYGNHAVALGSRHSKIWVITDEEDMILEGFEYLDKHRVPEHSSVNKECAYYLTIGAGPVDNFVDEMGGDFNRPYDISKELGQPFPLFVKSKDETSRLITVVDQGNRVMNGNFLNTTLEYDLFIGGWTWHAWDEFNSNSYIAGVLPFIGFMGNVFATSVPGFEKPVPLILFQQSFTNDEKVRRAIYK
jgi:hypothetical protein